MNNIHPYPPIDLDNLDKTWLYVCPACNRRGILWEFQAWETLECPQCGNMENIAKKPNRDDSNDSVPVVKKEPEKDIHKLIKVIEKPKSKPKTAPKTSQHPHEQIGLFR